MLSLHNLDKAKSSKSRKKRLGRGNASGKGNYSTRGMKGQRARSGGKSGLASRSIKGYLLRIPKVRGFKSLNQARATINIGDLDKNFNDGDRVNARLLLKAGLITSINSGVKVLSAGKLSKKLIVEADDFSKDAKEKISKAGGETKLVKKSSSAKEVKEDKDSK